MQEPEESRGRAAEGLPAEAEAQPKVPAIDRGGAGVTAVQNNIVSATSTPFDVRAAWWCPSARCSCLVQGLISVPNVDDDYQFDEDVRPKPRSTNCRWRPHSVFEIPHYY